MSLIVILVNVTSLALINGEGEERSILASFISSNKKLMLNKLNRLQDALRRKTNLNFILFFFLIVFFSFLYSLDKRFVQISVESDSF